MCRSAAGHVLFCCLFMTTLTGSASTRMSPFWILSQLRMTEVVSGDNWSYKTCKAAVKMSSPTNQHPVFFTGRMPFLSPNQQRQSTEGNLIYMYLIQLCEVKMFALSAMCQATA